MLASGDYLRTMHTEASDDQEFLRFCRDGAYHFVNPNVIAKRTSENFCTAREGGGGGE